MEYRLKELRQTFKDRDQTESESSALEQLDIASENQREVEFEEAREEILNQIREGVAERVWGEQAKQIASLRGDRQFEEAVRILKSQSIYQEKMKLAFAENESP